VNRGAPAFPFRNARPPASARLSTGAAEDRILQEAIVM
jgi:hypothetical protein